MCTTGGRHEPALGAARTTTSSRWIPASRNARQSNWCDAHRVLTRCLIVDDNEPFLEAARVLLEREGLRVAAVAPTYAEALDLFETLRPDVVLIDVFLGEQSGLELARDLAEDGHGPGGAATVILISTHTEADLGDLIAASPAAGFLLKSELSAEAIRSIVAASERRGR
jgi:DNA-binding NarL/FixJ family response regulator